MTKEELKNKLLSYDTPYIDKEGNRRMTDGFCFSDEVLGWFSDDEIEKATDVELDWIKKKAGSNGWEIKLI